MQFLTSGKENWKKMSQYSLEFPNKRESAARQLRYGLFGKQRSLVKTSKSTDWSLSPLSGHQERPGSGRQDPYFKD